jgi:hypothetical protein
MKKFVSLGTALMLGTVLARGNKDQDHSIARSIEKKKKDRDIIQKKEYVDSSIEEYMVNI